MISASVRCCAPSMRFLSAARRSMLRSGPCPRRNAPHILSCWCKEGDAAWRKAIIDFLFNLVAALAQLPAPRWPSWRSRQHLLEDLNDKQTDLISEEKRLVENLQFLNAILSGESGIGGQKPTFHNSPHRRCGGREQPDPRFPTLCRSPAVAPAAEAREPGRRELAARRSRGRPAITNGRESRPRSLVSRLRCDAAADAARISEEPVTAAYRQGRGVGTWFSQSPTGGRGGGAWRDPDDPRELGRARQNSGCPAGHFAVEPGDARPVSLRHRSEYRR